MSVLRKAAEELIPILDRWKMTYPPCSGADWDKVEALRQALAQPEQEPVTLLPDGSAFGVMSFPLPDSHWLYAEREYRDGEHEPIELGKPILTHELRDAVVSAVRYAIRGATNCGKEMDFDPDALVQNAVYALCGPYARHVDAVNTSQECVDETTKREHEPVAWLSRDDARLALWDAINKREFGNPTDDKLILDHLRKNGLWIGKYTSPPPKQPEQECIYPECETGIGCDGPCGEQPVDETAKRRHKPGLWAVQYKDRHEFVWGAKPVFRGDTVLGLKPLYTAPPKREHLERLCRIMGTFDLATGHADTVEQALDALESELRDVLGYLRAKREWVGLTDEERERATGWSVEHIESYLKEKNT